MRNGLSAIALLFILDHAFAGTSNALVLGGMVRSAARVSVYRSPASIRGADAEEFELARVAEFMSGDMPYTVTITSANAGRLSDGKKPGPEYSVTYDSELIDLRKGSAGVFRPNSPRDHARNHGSLRVRLPKIPEAIRASSRYFDILTLSIAAM